MSSSGWQVTSPTESSHGPNFVVFKMCFTCHSICLWLKPWCTGSRHRNWERLFNSLLQTTLPLNILELQLHSSPSLSSDKGTAWKFSVGSGEIWRTYLIILNYFLGSSKLFYKIFQDQEKASWLWLLKLSYSSLNWNFFWHLIIMKTFSVNKDVIYSVTSNWHIVLCCFLAGCGYARYTLHLFWCSWSS